jgi:hypothetical protein
MSASRKLTEVERIALQLSSPPSAAQVATACQLARTVLHYLLAEAEVLKAMPSPARALECAEAWVREGAPPARYWLVALGVASAAGEAAYTAAVAARAPWGSAERLEADLATQAALAVRSACEGSVEGVQECLRAIAHLTSAGGAGVRS